MLLCLFEDEITPHLAPLIHTRAVFDLRIGYRTIAELAHARFGRPNIILQTRPIVARVTGAAHQRSMRVPDGVGVLYLNGRYVPEKGELLERIRRAASDSEPARAFIQDDAVVAAWVPAGTRRPEPDGVFSMASFDHLPQERIEGAHVIRRLWDLINGIGDAITDDYVEMTGSYLMYEREGARVSDAAILVEPERIYTAPGATIRAGAILSAEEGPIYIGEGATICEGAIIRGPVAIGPNAQVLSTAVIDDTVVGPWCKAGGEIKHTILHSYSNKAHIGYLGHAYLGSWVNIGAASSNSNLKNDYGIVSMHDPVTREFESTGLQFLGMVVGDHSKCAIGTRFNTGTVIGTFCNLFGDGFAPRLVPSFSWGAPGNYQEYRPEKALKVAELVMSRRDVTISDADRELITSIFEATREEREVGPR